MQGSLLKLPRLVGTLDWQRNPGSCQKFDPLFPGPSLPTPMSAPQRGLNLSLKVRTKTLAQIGYLRGRIPPQNRSLSDQTPPTTKPRPKLTKNQPKNGPKMIPKMSKKWPNFWSKNGQKNGSFFGHFLRSWPGPAQDLASFWALLSGA